ncbi:carboxypeptidase family protein [Archangium gephyra]|uniref:Carboxypeptidase family protein n=1 Tax=Archangium gephyra TaxID=48 RepID=A0AAC8Q847_9BACT|nr:carboxypeptidase regulatory-like domain-containing protein [Archangium gephyra]AKJ02316.1 PDZ domain protein [Archangium gephyra]REG28754.1 carboxypeptidase family protein [Archangium gephyra]
MRKRTLAAAVVLGLGLGLLLLTLHSREAQVPSGDAPAVPSSPRRTERGVRPERSEASEVLGTAEEGGTPPLAHPATEADGVLLVEVFAKERPVAGASVRLYWRGPRDPNLGEATWRLAGSGSTDARGQVRLPSRPGSYLVTARAPGQAAQARDVVRPQGEALTRLRLTLEAGHSLSGRTVVKGTGEPLPLVELSLIAHGRELKPWEDVEAPLEERIFAHSDARGVFRVEGLSAGTWLLRAEAPGYGPELLDEVRIPAEGPLELALSRAGIIEGFVVDAEGRPAPGAEVRVSGGVTQQVVTTGQGGGFSAEVEAGSHTVSARRGDEAGALDSPVVVAAGGTVRDVRVRLGASALLEGRVVARTSQAPVVGATVDVSPSGVNGDSGRAVTDAEGRFSVEGLAPGLYDVVVAATGFSEAIRQGLTLAPGERFLVELELVGTGAVEGTVRDGAGHPLAGVRVEAGDRWTPEGLSSTPLEARTNAEGYYRLEGLASGRVGLSVYREGASAGQGRSLFLAEGSTARADFTLEETGTLEGVVRLASGRWPGKSFQVYAYPERSGHLAEGDSGIAEVGDAGTFRMQLPPGPYEVMAEHPEDESLRQRQPVTVSVEPGKTVRVELTLEPPEDARALLRGRVLEPDGSPSPSAMVLGQGPSDLDMPHFWARSDGEGRFQHAISEGAILTVRASNGGRLGRVQEARAGQEVVVRLQPAASVRGRVVRANGAPVRGFTLGVLPLEPGSSPWMWSDQEFPSERFELKDLPGERVRMEARSRDGARGTALVTLAPGASAEVEILLGDMGRLGGRAVDMTTGAPLAGASVFVSVDPSSRFQAISGADGRFLVEGLPAGNHTLFIFGLDGAREDRTVALEAGQSLELGNVPVGASPP